MDRIKARQPWLDSLILGSAFLYSRLWHRWSCNRPAPFPSEGGALVVSNHTCSADPPNLQAGSPRLLSFLVSREHYKLHPVAHAILNHLRCVPVTRSGQDPGALLGALRRLAEGRIVCVFPEGNLSGVARGTLRAGKPGAAWLALRSKLPVYPVFISGGPRTHRLLESWVRPSPKALRVTYGNAVDLTAYYGLPITRRLIEQVTCLLMRKIVELNPNRHGCCPLLS